MSEEIEITGEQGTKDQDEKEMGNAKIRVGKTSRQQVRWGGGVYSLPAASRLRGLLHLRQRDRSSSQQT